MDMSKYRYNSSFANLDTSKPNELIRNKIIQQAINEFDIYQQYAPNTYEVFVNGGNTPILGTMIDLSDLEATSDTKWLLTSLNNEICAGDVLTIDNQKWLCIYDKKKTTKNCFKVKIEPCNYALQFPYYKSDGTASIYTADSIVLTYLTSMKELKQPFPTKTGQTYVTVQYNEITDAIIEQFRFWLYTECFSVVGKDYTSVNYYIKKGVLKFVLEPTDYNNQLDNKDLGICDYYKYFPKTAPPPTTSLFNISYSNTITTLNKMQIKVNDLLDTDIVKFEFVGDNLNCTLTNITNNSCYLNAGTSIGFITLKVYLANDTQQSQNIRIVIRNN